MRGRGRECGNEELPADARRSCMIGISFHTGGFQDKPFEWVARHLGELGYDGAEIVCGPTAHIRTSEPLEPQLDRVRQVLAETRVRAVAINPFGVNPLPNHAPEEPAYQFYTKLI